MVGRRTLAGGASHDYYHARKNSKQDNANNPFRPKPAVFRFQDTATGIIEDERRKRLKSKLIDSVKGNELESYRKSDEEVSLDDPISRLK